jgi:hypothetical protein
VLRLVDVDAARARSLAGFDVADVLDHVVAGFGKGGQVRAGLFQEVQGDEFRAEGAQFAEQVGLAGERQAREVNLEELGVAAAVRRAVEHGVQVIEHVFRPEGLRPVALAVGHERHAQPRPHIRDKLRRKVRTTATSSIQQVLN